MDLVGVDQEEERLLVVLPSPLQGGVQCPGGAVGVGGTEHVLEGGVLEGLEAPLEERPGHLREGPGAVARRGERLSEGGDLLPSRGRGPLAVHPGRARRRQGGHRRQVPGRRGHRPLEADPLDGQLVEGRRGSGLVAVAAQDVGAQAVHHNEDDVGPLGAGVAAHKNQRGRRDGSDQGEEPSIQHENAQGYASLRRRSKRPAGRSRPRLRGEPLPGAG